MAAVGQLLLVGPDVLQELVQLLEGLGAGLQHTLIDLQGRELVTDLVCKKRSSPVSDNGLTCSPLCWVM